MGIGSEEREGEREWELEWRERKRERGGDSFPDGEISDSFHQFLFEFDPVLSENYFSPVFFFGRSSPPV